MGIHDRNYVSLYRGVVVVNEDTEGLGRCKIRIPVIHGENTPASVLPWARPLVLSPVKKKRGSVNIPDVGDIVWIMFEGANRQFPVYLGGTYSNSDEITIDNNIVDFYIENDDKISYNRETRVYDIKIGDRHIQVSPEDIKIKGNVIIEGSVTVTDTLTAEVDVVGGGVSLVSHTHDD